MKICPLFLKWDYGIESKGESLEKKIFLPALQNIFYECVPFWLEENGFKDDLVGLQSKIIEFITKEKADVVFTVLMEYEISQGTLKWIKDQGIKVINFFCDTTWRWEWVKTVAPYLTHSFDTDLYSLAKYKEIGCDAVYCQWGAYEHFRKPLDEPYKYDISFVGGWSPGREWWVSTLLPEYKVECFGNDWPNGRCELKDVIPYSKINLNLSNSVPKDVRYWQSKYAQMPQGGKTVEQIKLRHFEIQALGGFQLANHAIGTPANIETFSDPEDLKRAVKYYLEDKNRTLGNAELFENNLFKAFRQASII